MSTETDPIWDAIRAEGARQASHLEMIASENHTSREVMEAMASCLTDKYAEGYPGRRYYGGCERVDEVERICRNRAKELFGVKHANVQPHSGTQANVAAFMALLSPGDRVLGMSLDHGGHLSHGHPKNFSGLFYEFHGYGVGKESGRIDMDQVRDLAKELRPRLILVGASAYPRIFEFETFREIADEVGAMLMVDQAHIAGLVAAGVHPNPAPFADVVTMTTHKTLRGPRGGMILSAPDRFKGINSAVFPGDQGGPFMHAIAAKAIALREAATEEFRDYAAAVVANCAHLAEVLLGRGLQLVSGGTDNHMLLVDVSKLGLSGQQAEEALGDVHITVNKNLIPYDPATPMDPSGIRIGTPAVTTRGLGLAEIERVGEVIADVLGAIEDSSVRDRVRAMIAELTEAFPIPNQVQADIATA
ncbi:MAG TPA: serine hydroxymethyltransferase [Planctomycetes bacterium]|nr:serine hydroxymethyltransferase [Planctomycetota bacterium]